MSDTQGIPVPGSNREPLAGAQYVSPVQHNDQIKVTLILRRRGGNPEIAQGSQPQRAFRNRADYGAAHGADSKDIEAVEQFAHENGLTVVERHEASRRIVLAGPADRIQKAFEVELGTYNVAARGFHYRGRKGEVRLPPHIQPVVLAVLGLDNRPVAKPHMRMKRTPTPGSFTPPQLAKLYRFPPASTAPASPSRLSSWAAAIGRPTRDVLRVARRPSAVGRGDLRRWRDGHAGNADSADGEVMLDVEVVGAVAPEATIAVYFAPNTDKGFLDADHAAVHDTINNPSLVSISWGASEGSWTDAVAQAVRRGVSGARRRSASRYCCVPAIRLGRWRRRRQAARRLSGSRARTRWLRRHEGAGGQRQNHFGNRLE